jgi:hypothetical protein
MSSLSELQTGFRTALLADDERRVAADILPDRLGVTARLAVYRHHVFTTLTTTLESTFPVVCRLVDRRFFGWLADCFIRAHPPAGPCLFEYGADFPEFVGAFPACAKLPWLPDIAALEWALNTALYAPDARPLDPEELAAIAPSAVGRLVFRLDPSVTLLTSRWPVDAIWRANQPEAGETDAVDLDAGPVRLEVRRDGEDVVFCALSPGGFALREALAGGGMLEAAIDSALAAEPSLDVAAELRTLLDARILVD